MSDDLVSKRRADQCATHSHACDCLEYAHAQEIERLRAENDALRALAAACYQAAGAHDWPDPWLNALSEAAHGDPFGNPMELLPMDSPDHLLRAERAETENVILREVAAEAELNREGLRVAHAELAKLRDRIEWAPVAKCTRVDVLEGHMTETSWFSLTQPRTPGTSNNWLGKRVALVVVDE